MAAAMDTLGGTLAASAGDSIKETTTASFRADVIAESATRPVLVDFWAPWCGPCKQLTPVIEKVVKAAGGKVVLVKMNIDDHPQIAGQLGIQSIPAVIAFQKGQPVDGFMGALPESQIKTFIERLVGPLTSPIEDILADGEAALAEGDLEASLAAFQAGVAHDPADARPLGGLVRALVLGGDTQGARAALESFTGHEEHAAIKAARAALELAEQASSLGDLGDLRDRVAASPENNELRFELALALNAEGKRSDAADALLELIRRDRSWNDDGARKQLIQFFEAWGPMDPATIAARRKLSAILFS